MKEEDILFYKSKYIFLLITFWFFLEKFILLVIIPNELIFLNVILEIIISFLIAMLLTLNIKNTKNGIRVGFLGVFFAIQCYFYANYFSKFFESNIIIEFGKIKDGTLREARSIIFPHPRLTSINCNLFFLLFNNAFVKIAPSLSSVKTSIFLI